jgi:hypothetical protein
MLQIKGDSATPCVNAQRINHHAKTEIKASIAKDAASEALYERIVDIVAQNNERGIRQCDIVRLIGLANFATQRRLYKLEQTDRIFSIRLPGRLRTRYFLAQSESNIKSGAEDEKTNLKSKPKMGPRQDASTRRGGEYNAESSSI